MRQIYATTSQSIAASNPAIPERRAIGAVRTTRLRFCGRWNVRCHAAFSSGSGHQCSMKLPKKVNLGLKWNADVQKAVKKVCAWIRRISRVAIASN